MLLIGDSAAQFTVQELGTLAREQLIPVVVVADNDGYAVERAIHGTCAAASTETAGVPGGGTIVAWVRQSLPQQGPRELRLSGRCPRLFRGHSSMRCAGITNCEANSASRSVQSPIL